MTDDTKRQAIEKLIHAIDAEAWSDLKQIFAPTTVYEVPGREPIIGVDGLLDYYRNERDVVGGRHQIDGVIVEGSHGVAWGRFSGKTSAGKQISVRFADRYEFAEGLVQNRMVYYFR